MNETSSPNGEEPPSRGALDSLKTFKSAGRGFWSDVSDADWNNWRWQLKHRITSLEQLQRLMPSLTPEEYAGTKMANTKLALAITPCFFNLIDPADENIPLRRPVVSPHRHAHSCFSSATHHAGTLRDAQTVSSAVHQHSLEPSARADYRSSRRARSPGRRGHPARQPVRAA